MNIKMRNITFTIFEETLIEWTTQAWDKFCEEWKPLTYLIFQIEISPTTGKKHLQGYCELKYSMPRKTFMNKFGCKFNCDPAKGTAKQNLIYCTKEDTSIPDTQYTYGKPKISKQGNRTDLDELAVLAKDLSVPIRDIADELPVAYMKFHKYVDKRRQMELEYQHYNELKQSFESSNLRKWQVELAAELKHTADDRTIRWIVDIEGNNGKTWFAKWAHVNMDAQIISGKINDIARAYAYKPIVIYNLPRTPEEKYIPRES